MEAVPVRISRIPAGDAMKNPICNEDMRENLEEDPGTKS
jgi:hypothetical protein